MFSSLASFLFGSDTNYNSNSETTATAITNRIKANDDQRNSTVNLVDGDNLIEVKCLEERAIKRGKNRRNNARQQNKRQGFQGASAAKATSPLRLSQATKLETPTDSGDEEFDLDDWFIVEKKEEEEDDFLVHNSSEEENVPVIKDVSSVKSIAGAAANSLVSQRRLRHINSHSQHSGPRPQRQRNCLQKARNNNTSNVLSVSKLSPSRTVNDGRNSSGQNEATADDDIIRSLYVAASTSELSDDERQVASTTNGVEDGIKMEESWFVTPPSCFTSIGPINMETSPYENLLIEHPSMSVYYSIKMAQEAAASFVKLDIGVNDMVEKQNSNESTRKKKKVQAVQTRNVRAGYRLDRQSVDQLKKELMTRNVQKIPTNIERRDICRAAIKRSNKARDVQSRNHTQRRCDRQHSKIFSNTNNNRKSNRH